MLIGDAAHTAHFSIGSGTKLAMEDAIALANSFVRHPDSVEQALTDYELERQPVVERFQQAAGDSAAYFGRVGHYTRLEPIQFAVNLLTRSGRISHANLTQRDPQLIRVLDAWFAGATAPGAVAPPPMFAPLAAGGLTVRNRVVRAGGDLADAGPHGRGSGADRVRRGVAGRADHAVLPAAGRLVGAGGGEGARRGRAGRCAARARGPARRGAGVRCGRSAAGRVAAAVGVAVAVRAVRGGAAGDDGAGHGARARRVRRGGHAAAAGLGFDVLELDLADGYLLASFLSPLSNRRTDAFGADRPAFPLSVVDAVRAAWPGMLVARLTVTDWARGGLGVEDGIAHARACAEHGVDVVHVRAGLVDGGLGTGVPARVPDHPVGPGTQRGRRAHAGRRLPDHAGRGEHGGRRGPRGPVPVRAAADAAGDRTMTAT